MALSIGINDYPGSNNDLSGCVNDAKNWSNVLVGEGYRVTRLFDAQATRANVLSAIRSMIDQAKFGDKIVITYSGHGSYVPDRDGDESDSSDECIVLYDWAASGFLTDDELYGLLQTRRRGVRVWFFSDSCYSGTMERFLNVMNAKVRFFPPSKLLGTDPALDNRARASRGTALRPATVLVSGCDEHEVSYDAFIDGTPQGAFSAAAMKTYAPGQTIGAWHKKIRQALPSVLYPQSPQLRCSRWQKYGKF